MRSSSPACLRSCVVEEVSWKSSFARWVCVANNMALSSQTLRWQETGGSIEIAAPESAARCIPLCGLVQCPIFRVPEYSEFLLRTGFVLGFLWEELGILKRGEKYPLRIVGLAERTGPIRCLNLRRRLFLECNSGHGQDGRLPNALQFSGGAIHFYNGGQVGWQEYSELSKAALLDLSARAIGRNRQLGIFRNSEYSPLFR